jgi:hypothetical protein
MTECLLADWESWWRAALGSSRGSGGLAERRGTGPPVPWAAGWSGPVSSREAGRSDGAPDRPCRGRRGGVTGHRAAPAVGGGAERRALVAGGGAEGLAPGLSQFERGAGAAGPWGFALRAGCRTGGVLESRTLGGGPDRRGPGVSRFGREAGGESDRPGTAGKCFGRRAIPTCPWTACASRVVSQGSNTDLRGMWWSTHGAVQNGKSHRPLKAL